MKTQEKVISLKVCASNYLITSVWYGLAFIVNKKWRNNIYKLGKIDDRSRSKSKKQPMYESSKMVLN